MAEAAADSKLTGNSKNVPYYIADQDLPELDPQARDLFVRYSHIPAEEVRAHVLKCREGAWQVFPFPCIGQMRFIDFSLSTMDSYPAVLAKLRDPDARLLDIGCCFGQDLRRLVADGVPSAQLVGVELHASFLDLGYELFKDRDTYKGRMVAADLFDEGPASPLRAVDGTIDVVHAASFFHLFNWENQVRACTAAARLLRAQPGVMLMGRQLGSSEAQEHADPTKKGNTIYIHSPETFAKLWAEVSEKMGVTWTVNAWLQPRKLSLFKEEKHWMDDRIQLLYFEVTRA